MSRRLLSLLSVRSKKRTMAAVSTMSMLIISLVMSAPTANAVLAPQPPITTSYYMDSQDLQWAASTGCNLGYAAAADNHDRLAILDFGGQLPDGSGTHAIGGFDYTNSQIEAIAYNFGLAFYGCTGNNLYAILHLAIGTNNSYGDVSAVGGQTWAGVVAAAGGDLIAKNAGQVAVEGADDIEPGFGDAPSAIAWTNGYAGAKTSYASHYIDYGSADGCPETSHANGACNNSWNQYDEWYVGWGSTASSITPEIYYQANANQWEQMSLYGASIIQFGAMQFWGPMDQYPLDPSSNTSAEAWTQLQNATNSNPATVVPSMDASLEINNE